MAICSQVLGYQDLHFTTPLLNGWKTVLVVSRLIGTPDHLGAAVELPHPTCNAGDRHFSTSPILCSVPAPWEMAGRRSYIVPRASRGLGKLDFVTLPTWPETRVLNTSVA